MRQLSVVVLVLGSISTMTAGSVPQQRPLAVVVGDHVRIADSTLRKAVGLARQILRQGGVATEWMICASTQSEGRSHYACMEGVERPDVVLRILPEAAAGYRLPWTAMGLALVGNPGELGRQAYVFYDRVLQAANFSHCDEHRILGHAIAHEISHLLGNGHSTSGIMRSHWNSKGILEMSRGCVLFSPEQGRRMQANVAARELSLHAAR